VPVCVASVTKDLLTSAKKAPVSRAKSLPLKEYDPEKFWDSVGDEYYKTFQKRQQFMAHVPWLLDRLKVIKVDTLLDVGCGFGRVLPFLLEGGVVKETWGIDISESNIDCSKEYLSPEPSSNSEIEYLEQTIKNDKISLEERENLKVILNKLKEDKAKQKSIKIPDFRDRIHLSKGDVRNMDFDNGKFDCVLSCEVLQHLTAHDVEKACFHMLRVSKKYLIIIERWGFPGEHSEPHLFSHNYASVFEKLGVEIRQVTTIGPSIQGIIIEKRGLD